MNNQKNNHPLTFTNFLAPMLTPVYQFITDYVGQKLGVKTQLLPGTSFSQFATDGADVGFICGLPYIQLTRRPNPPVELLAAPVLIGERYGGKPIYFSDVIVRQDSPYQRFEDLRGTRWSYNDSRSHSGYNITRYKLVTLGEINGFFSQVIEAGSHQQSLRLLLAGKIDATALDSHLLDLLFRDHPALHDQIRVIDQLGPASIQPVAAASSLATATKAAIQEVLLTMHQDPVARQELARGLIERFVAVEDQDYDDINAMVDAAESIGFYRIQ